MISQSQGLSIAKIQFGSRLQLQGKLGSIRYPKPNLSVFNSVSDLGFVSFLYFFPKVNSFSGLHIVYNSLLAKQICHIPLKSGSKHKCCEMCGSPFNITFHHLIPKTCHKNKWFKKNFSLDDMRKRGIFVCRKCHSFIHKKFSEKYLGRELNTLQKLLANEDLAKYVNWAKKNH